MGSPRVEFKSVTHPLSEVNQKGPLSVSKGTNAYRKGPVPKRVGCRFVPDPDKLMAFRRAKREEQAVRDHYRAEMKKLAAMPDPVREW